MYLSVLDTELKINDLYSILNYNQLMCMHKCVLLILYKA